MVHRSPALTPGCPCIPLPWGLRAWGNNLQVCSFYQQTCGPVCRPCTQPESEPCGGEIRSFAALGVGVCWQHVLSK